MLKKTIDNTLVLVMAALLMLGMASCRDEDIISGFDDDDPTVGVSAQVLPPANTRANPYIEDGPLTSGTYHLHYPPYASTSAYRNAFVDFGDEEGPSTGFAYVFIDGRRKDLKWRHVYNEGSGTQEFCLTNIDTAVYTIYHENHWEHMRFNLKNVQNPYVASPLDTVGATNDLLFGKAKASRGTGKINFPLEHGMALVKVNLEVISAEDEFMIDLSNAEVTLTTMSTELGAFDLRDGHKFEYNTSTSTNSNSGGYQNYPCYYRNIKDVNLVEPGNPDVAWATHHPGKMEEQYQDAFTKEVYETMRWVFPPQSVPTNSSSATPVLIVKVPYKDATGSPAPPGEEYKIYQGKLPGVMFEIDENGNYISSPEVLSLKGGHQLNITASINSPETDLTFAPVTIEPWVSKGSFTITTKQAGIYNSTDFRNVSRLFKAGRIDALERYGSVDGDLIELQIWANINLDLDEITECMNAVNGNRDFSEKFEFVFNGYTITTTRDGEKVEELSGAIGQEALYNIVTGRDVHDYKAIHTTEDFMRLFNACLEEMPVKDELKEYGYFNNMDNQFMFDIQESIDIPIEDIFMLLPAKVLGYNIQFSVDRKSTRLNSSHCRISRMPSSA